MSESDYDIYSYAEEQYRQARERDNVVRMARLNSLEKIEGLDVYDKKKILHEIERQEKSDKLLLAMERAADHLGAIRTDLQLAYTRRGKTYGNVITLGTSTTMIDFVRPVESVNLPAGFFVDTPFAPIPTLVLYVQTGKGDVYYSTNEDTDNTKTQSLIESGRSVTLDFREPTIERINLRATQASTVLNLTALI